MGQANQSQLITLAGLRSIGEKNLKQENCKMSLLSRKKKIKSSRKSGLANQSKKENSPFVLVVSALEDTRVLFSTLLPIWGYSVAEVEKTDDCDGILEQTTPDLILMELPKSFAEGLADFSEIRRKIDLKNIPVILLSGYPQPQYRDEALKFGADDFLVMPLDFDNLEEILQNYFTRPKNNASLKRRFEAKPHLSL